MSLRSKLIRLAHTKPELREHLLPLLKVAATKRDLEKLYALAKGIPNVGVFRVSDKKPKHFRHMHEALNGYSFDMDYKILDLTVYQQTTSRDQKKYRFFVDERGSDLMVADGDRFENPRVVSMAQAKKIIKAMEPEDKIPPGLIELLKREEYSYEIVGSDRVFVHAPMVDYYREDWEYDEAGLERWLKKEYNKLLRKMDKKIERSFPDILIQWHNEMLILRF